MTDVLPDRTLLPPMTALRAFEAAARLGSFTMAADELHVTQGAISRQIKLLEDWLSTPLFDRARQRITLTDAGRFYAQHVAESLGYLMSAAAQTKRHSDPGSHLHIGIVPTFCSRWIIPRLRSFTALYPRLRLRLSAVNGDLKFALDDYDAVLVVGRGAWPNAISHRLEAEELIAVAAPAWIKSHGVRDPSDLIGPPLLVHAARPNLWSRWFALNSVEAAALVPSMLSLDQVTMIIEAAVAELGAALLPRALIAREIESEELAIIKGHALFVSDGFHFVYAPEKKSFAPVIAFRDWILGAT